MAISLKGNLSKILVAGCFYVMGTRRLSFNKYVFFVYHQVLPISCFTYHCEAKWIKMLLQSDSDRHLLCENNRISSLSSSGKSYGQSKRRNFPIEDTGIVLLGSLKVSN